MPSRHPSSSIFSSGDHDFPPSTATYLVDFLTRLLNTPSPTGFTDLAVELCRQERFAPSRRPGRTRKGALVAAWPGRSKRRPARPDRPRRHAGRDGQRDQAQRAAEADQDRRVCLEHGGGRGLTVFTARGRRCAAPAARQSLRPRPRRGRCNDTKRDDDNMEVRLDERTTSRRRNPRAGHRGRRLRGLRPARRSDQRLRPLAPPGRQGLRGLRRRGGQGAAATPGCSPPRPPPH